MHERSPWRNAKKNRVVAHVLIPFIVSALWTGQMIFLATPMPAMAVLTPHVEYSFTEKGNDLMPIFYQIMIWGFKHENDWTSNNMDLIFNLVNPSKSIYRRLPELPPVLLDILPSKMSSKSQHSTKERQVERIPCPDTLLRLGSSCL